MMRNSVRQIGVARDVAVVRPMQSASVHLRELPHSDQADFLDFSSRSSYALNRFINASGKAVRKAPGGVDREANRIQNTAALGLKADKK